MTGDDIVWWLQGIWEDLTDLGSADVPLLVFKLFVLFVVAFFVWQVGRMVVRAIWSAVGPLLRLPWRIVTAPVRLPWRCVRRAYGAVRSRRYERQRRRVELAAAERQRDREAELARKDAEALAAARRILDVD